MSDSVHDLLNWWGKCSKLELGGKITSCLDFSVKDKEPFIMRGRLLEIDNAVKELPYRHRQAISYHYVRRYSKPKAAHKLGIKYRMYISLFDSAIEKLEIIL